MWRPDCVDHVWRGSIGGEEADVGRRTTTASGHSAPDDRALKTASTEPWRQASRQSVLGHHLRCRRTAPTVWPITFVFHRQQSVAMLPLVADRDCPTRKRRAEDFDILE